LTLFRDRAFISNGLAHLAVDLLGGQRAMLLAVFSIPLGLSNALIGLVGMLSNLTGSVSQPLFGWLADRTGARWLAAGGVLWMGLFSSLAVITPDRWPLSFLVIASLGSGAFHPAGAMEATQISRDQFRGREATAASLFFLFGSVGFALGPAMGGPILERWGPPGLLLLLVAVVPIALNAAHQLSGGGHALTTIEQWKGSEPRRRPRRGIWVRFGLFVLLIGFRSWAQQNMVVFLPKYFSDLGYRPVIYGVIASSFTAGGAVGMVIGGWLGDRYSRKGVILLTLLASGVPLLLYPRYGSTGWTYLITPLAGALTGAAHSILVVVAQNMMPRRMGAASGLVLGFTFASGAVGTYFSGIMADRMGFDALFQTSAGLALLAGLLGFSLRVEKPAFEAPHPC
jgi:FSR family fosmidomycin resistance protein-like MFS transporter